MQPSEHWYVTTTRDNKPALVIKDDYPWVWEDIAKYGPTKAIRSIAKKRIRPAWAELRKHHANLVKYGTGTAKNLSFKEWVKKTKNRKQISSSSYVNSNGRLHFHSRYDDGTSALGVWDEQVWPQWMKRALPPVDFGL